MGGITSGGDDQTRNTCGINNGHAYAFIAAFTLYELPTKRNPVAGAADEICSGEACGGYRGT